MASIEGAVSEITFVNKPNDKGEVIKSAVFKFETQNPAQFWDVKIKPEQVQAGIVEELRKYEAPKDSWSKKPVLLNIEYYEGYFAGNPFKGFRLNSIATQNTK